MTLARENDNPEEWKSYADKEYKEDKAAKKVLFYVICGFSIVFGLGFTIYDPENGKFVFLVLFGVIAIIAPFAFLQPLLDYQRNRKYLGEVYISRSGVYLNRVLHTWRDLGARLDSVVYEKESRLSQFTYEVPTRSGMQPCNVRVPVPLGEEDTARKLINTFDGDGDVKVETEGIAPVS